MLNSLCPLVMAALIDVSCGVCDTRRITKCADFWCPECGEGLCSECQSHHTASKASRLHRVISISNYKKLQISAIEIVHHCKEHDMKFTNFCQQHDAFCCPGCISSSHKECLGHIVLLQELVKSSKTSSTLLHIEQSCKDLKRNIAKIMMDGKQNLLQVEEQRKMIQIEIKQMRLNLNLHLDRLEEDVINQLFAAEEEIKSQLETFLTQLCTESSTIDELYSKVLALKGCASDLQSFLVVKPMKDKIEEKEKIIKSLMVDRNLQRLNLTCHINEKLVVFLSTVTTFGSICSDTSLTSIHIANKKSIEDSQIMTILQEPPPRSVNDIALTLHSTISIPPKGIDGNRITGCTCRPNMRTMFADHSNGRLVLLNENGTLHKNISCCQTGTGPYDDVSSIDDKTVAVTTNTGIHTINTESNQTERTIKSSGRCYGITYHNGALLWCEVSKGIQKLQLTDDSVTTVVKQCKLIDWSYITTCGDKIYQTEYCNHAVTCFTTKGEKLWIYKDESVVARPTGVAVDNNFNVFITSCGSNSVMVLSPEGKQRRKILGKEHGIISPWALHFDKNRNKLLVCNNIGSAYVFNVS